MMQIPVVKLLPTTVTVELDENDIAELREIINDQFLAYVEYAKLVDSPYLLPKEAAIVNFCDRFGVDGSNRNERTCFFRSLLAYLK